MVSVYLASKSERRKQLLAQIGLEVAIINLNIPEEPELNETPLSFVSRMALTKAKTGWIHADRKKDIPLIGADTIVICNDKIIGKPRNKDDGLFILKKLSGQTHQVVTAVAIVYENIMQQCYVESKVTFAELTDKDIEYYWNTGEPCDKAGAYAIQGKAAMYITNLSGSYSAVVGLPLYETAQLLRKFISF